MQTVRQSGYQVQRVRGQKRAETMVMECVICFAAMKKLKTGAPGGKLRQPFGMWGSESCIRKARGTATDSVSHPQGSTYRSSAPDSVDVRSAF